MRLAGPIAAFVALAGCATVTLRHDERQLAVVLEPFYRTVLFSRTDIPAGVSLYPARVGRDSAYCSAVPLHFAPGEGRGICLFDTQGTGVFDQYYVAGTLASIRIPAHVPYQIIDRDSVVWGGGVPIPPGSPNADRLKALAVSNQIGRGVSADHAECQYQSAAATAATGGVLTPAVTASHLYQLCMNAKAARASAGRSN